MLRRRTQQLIKREGFGAQRIICRRTGVNPSSLCQWLRGNLESSKVEQAMEGLLAELAASGEGLGLANLGGDGSRALAASSKGKTVLKRMRELIKAEGYGAQRKVVRMSGINQSSLCQWLKGNFSTPRVEQAMEKLLAEVAAGKGLSPAPPPARAVRAPKRPPASKPARASRTISKRSKSSSRVAATAAPRGSSRPQRRPPLARGRAALRRRRSARHWRPPLVPASRPRRRRMSSRRSASSAADPRTTV